MADGPITEQARDPRDGYTADEMNAMVRGEGLPLVKGPDTFTTACTCDSQLPGYHRMDCGVYA